MRLPLNAALFAAASLPATMPLATRAQSAPDSTIPMRILHATAGRDAERSTKGEAYSDGTVVLAALALRLRQADPAQPGAVTLEVSADTGESSHAERLVLRIPLLSTPPQTAGPGCRVAPSGERSFTFTDSGTTQATASFRPAPALTDVKLTLNTVLCNALKVTYICNGQPVRLQQPWDRWKLARTARLVLSSQSPSTLEVSPVVIAATETPFTQSSCP